MSYYGQFSAKVRKVEQKVDRVKRSDLTVEKNTVTTNEDNSTLIIICKNLLKYSNHSLKVVVELNFCKMS